MNFLKNNQGFSLVEIMVAAGMLGLLAVAGVKLMQSQTQGMKTIETKAEYLSIMNDIRTVLADSDSCRATLANRDAKNTATGTVTQIRHVTPAGTIVRYTSNANWKIAPAYGNGKIRIIGMRLSDAASDVETTVAAGESIGTTNLAITFTSGIRQSDKTLETFERNLRLNVTTNAGVTTIKDCNSTVADNSLNDMTKACASINGVYYQIPEKCILAGYPSVPATTYTAVSTQYLNDWLVALDQRYVNVTGDMMSGNLIMNASILMNGSIVISGTNVINFTSDRRKKKDIRHLKSTLPDIRKLSPRIYKWKSTGETHMGLIAQELALTYPELVNNIDEKGTLGIDYIQLTPVLLKGIQELDQENQKNKEELNLMKRELCKDNPRFKFCKR